MKKKLLTASILVLIVMTISFEACACNQNGVIAYLFGKHADSVEARTMQIQVQPVNQTVVSDTVMCTVKDAWFDGKTLAIGIVFQTEQPIYLAGSEVKVNGEWIDYIEYTSSIEEMWAGNEAPHQQHTSVEKNHGVKYVLSHAFPKGEKVRVTMHIPVLVSEKGAATVDTYQEDHPAMWAEIDAAYQKGLTPVSIDEPYEALISTGWWEEMDHNAQFQKPYGDVAALVRYANMEVMDTVDVAFVLEAQ